jgi:hypothetical protein
MTAATDTNDLMGLGLPPALAAKLAEMIAAAGVGVQLPAFTTAGGNEIAAGTVDAQLKAIADLADPA